jgi:hypothetical protein
MDAYSLEFPDWYDDLAEFEHEAKGYLAGVRVVLPSGIQWTLTFMEPTRLQQDLGELVASGRSCLSLPNLVVVPAVTRRAIVAAVAEMVREDFFKSAGPSGS